LSALSSSSFQLLSFSFFSFYPPVFLRRFALVVGGGFLGGFLATGQQAVDEGLAVLDQEAQPVAFLVVGTQGTEQARAHRVHLGFLHAVIQLQIREAAAGGLDANLRFPL
jgi:hypothetical protein